MFRRTAPRRRRLLIERGIVRDDDDGEVEVGSAITTDFMSGVVSLKMVGRLGTMIRPSNESRF